MIGEWRTDRGCAGFTLAETLASLVIFMIVTLGVVPLIATSLSSSGASRAQAIGDNSARAAMERLSGIKYYTSYDAKPAKVDLLDLYYPKASATGLLASQSYSSSAPNPPLATATGGTTGVFTTTCPDPSNPACPRTIAPGHTLVYRASFISPVTTTTPQTYRMVTPPANYAWNSSGLDAPSADMLDISVTDSWVYGGKTRSVVLRSIVGERRFTPVAAVDGAGGTPPPGGTAAPPPAPSGAARIQGEARLDYDLQGSTGFSMTSTGAPCVTEPCNRSDLNFTVGKGLARIETKDVSTADVSMRYAEGRVVRSYAAGVTPPASPPPDLAYVTGSYAEMHAPPYNFLATGPTQIGTRYLTHSENATNQARIYDNQLSGMKVDVGSEMPTAESYYRVPTSALAADVWMNNSQRDFVSTGPMHLDPAQPIFYTVRVGVLGDPNAPITPNGYVKANTGALNTPTRRVQTTAFANFPGFQFFRIWAGNNGRDAYNPVTFSYFTALVDCNSTANPATASATASWQVDLGIYFDGTNTGTTARTGSHAVTLRSSGNDTLNGASVPDAVASLKALNPLFWDGNSVCCTSTSDIYMFETRDASGNLTRRGYFADWDTLKSPPTSVSADGRATSASIEGALRVETASLRQTMAPDVPDTSMTFSFGNLSCSAVDNR